MRYFKWLAVIWKCVLEMSSAKWQPLCSGLNALNYLFQSTHIPSGNLGAYQIQICCLTSLEIPIIKIRWSPGHFIFILGIPILVRQCLHIEFAHCSWRWVISSYRHQPHKPVCSQLPYLSCQALLYPPTPYVCDIVKWQQFLHYWPFVRGIHQRWIPFTKDQ